MYVTGRSSHNVFRVRPDGTITQIMDAGDGIGNGLTSPTSLALDTKGNLALRHPPEGRSQPSPDRRGLLGHASKTHLGDAAAQARAPVHQTDPREGGGLDSLDQSGSATKTVSELRMADENVASQHSPSAL